MSELDSKWHLVSLLRCCMSLLDKCKWYVLETTAKLNHWVKSTDFFFSDDTACNRHSNDTMTIGKYVSKCKNMRKWMIEFETSRIEVAWVNSILITKPIDVQLFNLILYGYGVRCDLRRFSVLSPLIQKSICHNLIIKCKCFGK